MIYLLDTCSLIDQRRRYYPPDVFPALWVYFTQMVDDGFLRSSSEVLEELLAMDDEVSHWAQAQDDDFFVELDEETQLKALEILGEYPKLIRENAKGTQADPFLVGLAISRGWGIITAEFGTPTAKKRVRVPDVCRFYGVPCLSIIDFLREQKVEF